MPVATHGSRAIVSSILLSVPGETLFAVLDHAPSAVFHQEAPVLKRVYKILKERESENKHTRPVRVTVIV